MVALGEYRADMHVCGHPLSETTDPASEGRWTAGLPIRCHACTAIAVRQEDYREASHPQALLWPSERS